MAIQKINIERFLELSDLYPVFDVRSNGEFMHAHIPGANNLPLFNDEERKIVGTAYKQQSKQIAIKLGLDFFGVKMKNMVEVVEELVAKRKLGLPESELAAANTVIVHCWRGGMRSAGVAWLLDLYGFTVYTLVGGYKSYRKWAIEQFEKNYSLNVLGGYTGSGKTLVLHSLKEKGSEVIDLEKLANHKGSAFGALGEAAQPSQEMFENLLAQNLHWAQMQLNQKMESEGSKCIYIEDESQRVGNMVIPNSFWKIMRQSPVYFVDIPFEERLNYITSAYGKYEKEKLVNAIIRVQKRLGGLETKTAINHLIENNFKECFRILLAYYDKLYFKGLQNRENLSALLIKIPCESVLPEKITNSLINATTSVQ